MTHFDYAVLAILGLSLVWSLFRGVVREIVSLAGWAGAFACATLFSGTLARSFPLELGGMLAGLLAFLSIFLGVLVASGFVGLVLSRMVKAAGFGLADAMLGALFGLARGVVIVLVLVLLAGLTPLPKEPVWRDAVLSGPLETAVLALRPMLPEGLAQRLKYR